DLGREVAVLRRRLAEREAELAAHKTELAAALDRETATSEVLQVINASRGELAPVFDLILKKALHLCAASYGGVSTYDGERFHVAARRGSTPEYLEFMRTYTGPPAF